MYVGCWPQLYLENGVSSKRYKYSEKIPSPRMIVSTHGAYKLKVALHGTLPLTTTATITTTTTTTTSTTTTTATATATTTTTTTTTKFVLDLFEDGLEYRRCHVCPDLIFFKTAPLSFLLDSHRIISVQLHKQKSIFVRELHISQ